MKQQLPKHGTEDLPTARRVDDTYKRTKK